MTKTDLPPCSVQGCKNAGGAIVNGALFCTRHALVELDKILALRESQSNRIDLTL